MRLLLITATQLTTKERQKNRSQCLKNDANFPTGVLTNTTFDFEIKMKGCNPISLPFVSIDNYAKDGRQGEFRLLCSFRP